MITLRVRGLAVGFLAGCFAVVAVVGMQPTRAFADETGLVARDAQAEAMPGQPFQPEVVVDNTGDTAVDGFSLYLTAAEQPPSPPCKWVFMSEMPVIKCAVDTHLDPGERYEGTPFTLTLYGTPDQPATIQYGVFTASGSLGPAATLTVNFAPPPGSDLSVSGDTVSGNVGDTVEVNAGITDLGPAPPPDLPEGGPLLYFYVQFLGVTVVTVPERCQKSNVLHGSENYPDMNQVEFAGITEYLCGPAPGPDDPVQVTFAVRLNEPGQHRTAVGYFLAINGAPQFSDPHPDNDLAWLSINATGDDQAAGGSTAPSGSPTIGASSVTSGSSTTPGPPVALVHRSGPARLAVGLLAVVAVAAAAILALLRRRGPWPTIALPLLWRQRAQRSPSTGSEAANSDDGAADRG